MSNMIAAMELRPIKHAHLLRFQPGDRTGRLTVIRALGSKRFGGGVAVVFLCRCDCGAEIERDRQTLIKDRNHCCDSCSRGYTAQEGASSHPLFKVWSAMHDRCRNEKNRSYANYGGRGIKVCDRWTCGEAGLTGFECFIEDMGPRPSPSLTVERRDNSAGYNPTNCRWDTRVAQSRNRRGLRLVTHRGETHPASVWAERYGLNYFTFVRRLDRGWSIERALRKVA